MDTEVMNIITRMLWTAGIICAPILVTSLVIGFLVSIIQSVIQVQEPTLTFVPKVIGVAAVLVIGGSWMMQQMTTNFEELLQMAPSLIRQ